MKKLLILIFILLPLSAQATGVEVAPSRLEIEIKENGQTEQKITVSNPTADVLLFDVYADDFEDMITASPASFTLESGARKTIVLSLSPQSRPRMLTTNLSVVARPLADSRFSANAGVKIPMTINIVEAGQTALPRWIFYAYAGLAGLITIVYLIVRKFSRRLKKTF